MLQKKIAIQKNVNGKKLALVYVCAFLWLWKSNNGSLASVSLFYTRDFIYYVLRANNNIFQRVMDRWFVATVKSVCVCTAVLWWVCFYGGVMLV